MLENMYISYYPSPIGILKISFTASEIRRIDFMDEVEDLDGNNGCFFENKKVRDTYNLIYDQLNEYFTGNRKDFDLPIMYNGTDFQIKVWKYLSEIPYGEVKSYKEVAKAIGKPSSVRAVGQANSKNPLALIIPCHRVISSEGNISGYKGGKKRKKWLLEHERKYMYTKKVRKNCKFKI